MVGTGALPGPANGTVLRILEAGSACLAQFGNEKTSIQDVAGAAGVSRATVYRYFPDRAVLLQAVTDHEHAKLLGEVRVRAGEAGDLETALAVVVEVLVAAALRFRTREHLRNRDRGLAQYLFFQRADELRSIAVVVRPYVQRAHEAGELAADVSLEEAVEWIVMALAMIPALPPSRTFDPDDPVAVGRLFARRLGRGLLAPSADGSGQARPGGSHGLAVNT